MVWTRSGGRTGFNNAVTADKNAPGLGMRMVDAFIHLEHGGDAGVGAVEQLGPLRLRTLRERFSQHLPQLRPLTRIVAIGRVEAELGADLGDRLRARRQPREVRRRIARQQARQHERHDHDPDDARDRRHQPRQQQLRHQPLASWR